MLSKNLIKEIKLLHQSKYRKLHKKFIVEGPKNVKEYLSSDFKLDFLVHTEEYEVLKNVKSIACNLNELQRISLQKNPNQVLAVFHYEDDIELPNLNQGLYIALDAIRDPGNLGTIIRTAEWFGIKHILCSKDTVDRYNPKVIQSSMGACSRVKLHYLDLHELLAQQQDLNTYSTLMEGDNLYQMDLAKDAIIFIGNEANGLNDDLQKLIKNNIHIPRVGAAQTESLNASIATSLVIAEFRRSNHQL
jgi:TrmH family RNA methyltransferase